MHRMTLLLSTLALAWAAFVAGPAPASAQNEFVFEQPERVVVFGFTAGQLEPYRQTLIEKGLMNEADQWTGGETHYVQLGDMMLFGDEVLPSLELIHSLAMQAEEAGGRVTLMLGPSLFLALRGDLSNIPQANYDDLATEESQARLDERVDRLAEQMWEWNEQYDDEQRRRLNDRFIDYYRRTHHLGVIEFMDAIGPDTELGAWLRRAPAVIRIGDVVLSNGGVSEDYSEMSLAEINERVREQAMRDYVWVPRMANMTDPVWWKELTTARPDELEPRVREILTNLGADAMVVAHSPALGESMKRGRVYHLQSGLSTAADQTALIATLEIKPNIWFFTVGPRRFETQPPEPLVPQDAAAPDDQG